MNKADLRKQAILDATETLLVEVGGAAMTLRKVADRAGISLGNLQYHFAGRDELLMGLLQRFLSGYEAALKELDFQPTGDLQRDLESVFLMILKNPNIDVESKIFKEIWAASNQSEGLRGELTRYYNRIAEFYRMIFHTLTQGQSNHERTEQAIRVILPMIEGHCISRLALSVSDEELARDWASAIVKLCEVTLKKG